MNTRERVLIAIGCFFTLVLLCGACIFLPPRSHITQDFYLIRSLDGAYIGARWTDPGYIIVVESGVIDLDWNEEFIVVKRKPKGAKGAPNAMDIYWYVIDVEKNAPLGPNPIALSYNEYIEMRETLSVPDELALMEPERGPWEAYRRRCSKDD